MICLPCLFACSDLYLLLFRTAVSFPRHALLENSLPWPAAHVTAKGEGLGTNLFSRDPDPNTEMLRASPQLAAAGCRPASPPVPLLCFRPRSSPHLERSPVKTAARRPRRRPRCTPVMVGRSWFQCSSLDFLFACQM
ncbi:hypothetical protein CLIM01_02349 [Colletotrichum limetticola]|nr:hypothetical protein CLIM01_02349 [Colletotrichum limetticola]